MKAIQAWQTSDGRVFECKEDAEVHEKWIGVFGMWYGKRKLTPMYGDVIREEDMFAWLYNNREGLMEFLAGVR